jgi:hypothetical protein
MNEKTASNGRAANGRLWFERVHQIAELGSFLAIIAATIFGVFELRNQFTEIKNHQEDLLEATKREAHLLAESAYSAVDQKFADFMRVCIEHPELDCYSVPVKPEIKLSAQQQIQQKTLYSMLTDVFEVAFVQYVTKYPEADPAAKTEMREQWTGWEYYIHRFLSRPNYQRVWQEIGEEYDADFQKCINRLSTSPPDATTASRANYSAPTANSVTCLPDKRF